MADGRSVPRKGIFRLGIPSLNSSAEELRKAEQKGDEPVIQYVAPKNMKPYVRSCTKNVRDPSPAQAEHRERFARIMREQAGKTGMVDGVPVQAVAIRDRMGGVESDAEHRKRPLTKTEQEIVDYWVWRLKEEDNEQGNNDEGSNGTG